jgi:2'-5' RNA ligase
VCGWRFLEMDLFNLNEFSLWLEPTGHSCEYLQSVVKETCGELGAIPFIPHVTLLADIPHSIESWKNVEDIAQVTAPFKISFQEVSIADHHLKCLFSVATKNSRLTRLNKEMQQLYSLERSYAPHMSFAYGNFTLEKKEEIAKNLRNKTDLFSFEATAVSLWHAVGTPDHWKRLAKAIFKSRD